MKLASAFAKKRRGIRAAREEIKAGVRKGLPVQFQQRDLQNSRVVLQKNDAASVTTGRYGVSPLEGVGEDNLLAEPRGRLPPPLIE